METLVFFSILVLTLNTGSMAQNSTSFGDLPQAQYTADSVPIAGSGSLDTLFSMATGFVNIVFKPFSDVADYIKSVYSGSFDWQEAVPYEAGYIACLVFGVLFIVLVPLVGSIVCCCRCCCNKCGGRLEQEEKRSRSCYRQCLCATMLILTTLMAIPTIFVFLTNEWVRDVVDSAPARTVAVLNDITTYMDLVPTQLTFVTDQYSTVDAKIRPLVTNLNESVGIPLQEFVNETAQPSMAAMDDAIKVMEDSKSAIVAVDNSIDALGDGMTALNTNLTDLSNLMDSELSNATCQSDPACFAVSVTTDQLAVGFDVTQLNSLKSELDPVNDTLYSFDVDQLKRDVEAEIDNIPNTVQTQTQDASSSAISALDQAESSLDGINISSFDSAKESISDFNKTLTDAVTFYDENIDQYTYIAGVVLGSMLAVIVVSYLVGLLLGICGSSSDADPSERGCGSNCAGIMLMVGVVFSFVFSWLLMILVVVLFTVGGHGERYGCQSLEGPDYEGLALVEDIANLNLAERLGGNATFTITEVLQSCSKDESAYKAFRLDSVLDIDAEVSKVTAELDNVENELDTTIADIDLSTISVYTTDNQEQLLSLKDSGVDSINYTEYLSLLGDGLTAVNLTLYAQTLDESADNLTSAKDMFEDKIRGYATTVRQIQANQVVPLQDDYDTLQDNIKIMINVSEGLNTTIDDLDTALLQLNQTIQTEGKQEINQTIGSIFKQIEGNVTEYTDWVVRVVEEELGACKPLHTSYSELIAVFCDYFMDTINGLWFSLGWAVFFLIPSAIVAMKLMKFYRKMQFGATYEETYPMDMPSAAYLPGLRKYRKLFLEADTKTWVSAHAHQPRL